MGQVYLARSVGGRWVAVKVVRPELAEDPGFRRRFAREVTTARRVGGTFTAAVVDADPDGDPPWLATAYVPGVALDEAVTAHGPWPQHAARVLGLGVTEALEAIHGSGVVHRDLKPSNVLLGADGPRVIDFGISVVTDSSRLTGTGVIVGTAGFMAPEQLTGREVGPACDVFSLGVLLAFVASGSPPFGEGGPQAVNFRTVYEEPDLAGVPEPLRSAIVEPCLAKEPRERPSTAEILRRLTGDGLPPTAGPDATGWLPAPVAATIRERVTAPLLAAPPSAHVSRMLPPGPPTFDPVPPGYRPAAPGYGPAQPPHAAPPLT
ncbi:serine/threonine protein kinase, partial [Streptomyces sp. 8K308]